MAVSEYVWLLRERECEWALVFCTWSIKMLYTIGWTALIWLRIVTKFEGGRSRSVSLYISLVNLCTTMSSSLCSLNRTSELKWKRKKDKTYVPTRLPIWFKSCISLTLSTAKIFSVLPSAESIAVPHFGSFNEITRPNKNVFEFHSFKRGKVNHEWKNTNLWVPMVWSSIASPFRWLAKPRELWGRKAECHLAFAAANFWWSAAVFRSLVSIRPPSARFD